jgi:hypothetical protein
MYMLSAVFQSRDEGEEDAEQVTSLVNLVLTLLCILITSASGVEHLEKVPSIPPRWLSTHACTIYHPTTMASSHHDGCLSSDGMPACT